jgi:hypothetical protein
MTRARSAIEAVTIEAKADQSSAVHADAGAVCRE